MAKDPAVLFYTSDFLSGTFTMTNEQVGKYIRLLCLQHQKGVLSEKDMMNICITYDEDIFSKFDKLENGYANIRMMEESEKRKRYTESRRKNKTKSTYDEHMTNICETYDKHMENENEIVIIEDCIIKNVTDNKETINYKSEKLEKKDLENLEKNGKFVVNAKVYEWEKEKKKFIEDEVYRMKICTEKNLNPDELKQAVIDFATEIDLKADYKPVAALKIHFLNYLNKKQNDLKKRPKTLRERIAESDAAFGEWGKLSYNQIMELKEQRKQNE